MNVCKPAIVLALALVISACGADRRDDISATPIETPTPIADTGPSQDDVLGEINLKLFALEAKQEEFEVSQGILVEALSYQGFPLDRAQVDKLKKNSGITLQWIGNERGTLAVTESPDGRVLLSGKQVGDNGQDTLTLEGRLVLTTPQAFVMVGTIDHDVQELRESGEARCHREGVFTFRITGDRKYWRIVEQTGHCGVYTDYVDIFL